MTEHLPIQDPDDYDEADLMQFAETLFSPLTDVNELDRICMTLAHIPSKEAQELLNRFKDKVIEYLRASIQTEKYKNVDHSMMQHIHFD